MKHSSEYDQESLKELIHEMQSQPLKGRNSRGSIAENFRMDYQDFVGNELGRSGDFTYDTPGFSLYILRGNLELPNGALAEYAVLENPKTNAYVVLRGERNKSDFAYEGGIFGFTTVSDAPLAEVKELFRLWDSAMAPLKKNHSGTFARMTAIRDKVGRANYDLALEKYLAPLLGPGHPGSAVQSPANSKPNP